MAVATPNLMYFHCIRTANDSSSYEDHHKQVKRVDSMDRTRNVDCFIGISTTDLVGGRLSHSYKQTTIGWQRRI